MQAPSNKGALTLKDAVDEFRAQIEERQDLWVPQLPTHISPDYFRSQSIIAVNTNPDLLRADRRSLLNELCKAATDGLKPDGREGALVIFNTNVRKKVDGQWIDNWIKKVQWMPMVYGIVKKARQSGELSGLRARIVYANEVDQSRFSYIITDGVEKINHEPILTEERGDPVLAYAVATFKDGFQEIECLTKGDVEKVRRASKAGKDKDGNPAGIWKDWQDEMWKKTAMRRLCKRLPLSSELMDTVARVDDLYDYNQDTETTAPDTQSVTRAAALMSAGGAGQPANAAPLADEIEGEITGDGDREVDTEEEESPDDAPGEPGEEEGGRPLVGFSFEELRDEYLPLQITHCENATTLVDLDQQNVGVRKALAGHDELIGIWNGAYLKRKLALGKKAKR